MTDHPRGAYTPQQEVPLQFDPRSSAARRPMPMALIASGALLLVLVAAVAMYYSRGVRGDNEPPRPVGEPLAAMKAAPAAGAQPADASAGLDVSAPQNVPTHAPAFAAAPEVPRARPEPGTPNKLTVQTLSAAEMPKPGVAATGPAPLPLRRSMAVDAAAPPPAPPALALAKLSAPSIPTAATGPAPVAAPKAVTATAAGDSRVQIGAFSSAALADKGWSDVAALLPEAMGGKTKHVEAVDKAGQTLYRTSVSGFADRASAAAFCDSLKAKGKICFVKS